MSNHNKETEARCPHCYRHYVEGTAAWVLYMMRMGRKVTNPKYDPRVYYLPEGGMIHVNGIKSIAGNQWVDYWCIDIPDGWEIYEEPKPKPLLAEGAGRCGMKDTMVKSYECPICHEEITAEKLVILPEDEHELHEELLGNIGDHMFSCHEAKRTPDAEQLEARIAELEAELKAYKFALENAIIDRTLGGNNPLAQYVAEAIAELNRQAQEEK